jgi:hypothetical protein
VLIRNLPFQGGLEKSFNIPRRCRRAEIIQAFSLLLAMYKDTKGNRNFHYGVAVMFCSTATLRHTKGETRNPLGQKERIEIPATKWQFILAQWQRLGYMSIKRFRPERAVNCKLKNYVTIIIKIVCSHYLSYQKSANRNSQEREK